MRGHRPSAVEWVITNPLGPLERGKTLRPCTRRGCSSWVEVERL